MICRSFEGPLAQLVEQLAFNQLVDGSNPSRPTIFPLYFNVLRSVIIWNRFIFLASYSSPEIFLLSLVFVERGDF